jgi:hypothetical protein
MNTLLLNLIPNDILNLIWTHISPHYKYLLNKYYFNKYYSYRLYAIHNYKLSGSINNFTNYSYYYYILTNDLLYFSKNILTLYITNNSNSNKETKNNKDKYYYKKFIYKNLVFYNLVDFFYYYCNNKNEIINIINKYNLSHLIKKSHKNNANKNIRWTY